MLQIPRVDFIPPAKIREIAEGYLAEHHPADTIPIPIEEIIELKERYEVIPVEDLSAHGHEAFTSRNQQTIYIDKEIYMRENPNRRRSTLAHELAHLILHKPIFDAATFDDIAGWKQFLASMPDDRVKRIEIQAFELARHLLIPTHHFTAVYSQMAEQLRAFGMSDVQSLPPQALLMFAKLMGNKFQVSHNLIHNRAVSEGLWTREDMPS